MNRLVHSFPKRIVKRTGLSRRFGTAHCARATSGITLYEVVIALAIFAGSIAALSQALSTGTRAALQSRLQSRAVLLCQSKMAEMIGGAIPPTSAGDTPFNEPGLEGWSWAMNVGQATRTGIYQVDVIVKCPHATEAPDASFTLTRLIRDQQAFVDSATLNAKAKAMQAGVAKQQQGTSQ